MKRITIKLKPYTKAEQLYIQKLQQARGTFVDFKNMGSKVRQGMREQLEKKIGTDTPLFIRDWIENS